MTSENSDARAPKPEHHYNTVFEKLVGSIDEGHQENLRGLLAYGFYKVAKREWVSEHRIKNGEPPSSEELKQYAEMWTQSQIESTLDRADQALAEYADSVIQSAEPLILKRALQGSFRSGVLQSITANFVYTLLLVGFATILSFSGVDIVSIFERASEISDQSD